MLFKNIIHFYYKYDETTLQILKPSQKICKIFMNSFIMTQIDGIHICTQYIIGEQEKCSRLDMILLLVG